MIGIFKKPERCNCFIKKYVDRIWISENGDADILRTLILEVKKGSLDPLNEIRILSPYKYIKSLELVNETCFLPSSEFHFNSPEINTKKDYKVVQKLPDVLRNDSYGMIDHDGIKNIKVFNAINNSIYQVGECTVIRLQFPVPLIEGDTTEIRLKFRVNLFLQKPTTSIFSVYNVHFEYFSNKYIDEVDQLDDNLQIMFGSTLKKADESAREEAGFDIIIYLPLKFERVSGFENFYKCKPDFYNIQGKKDFERTKIMFSLSHLLKIGDKPKYKEVGVGENIEINGTFVRSYDEKAALSSLKDLVPKTLDDIIRKQEELDKKIKTSNRLAYLAIAIGIISLILYLLLW